MRTLGVLLIAVCLAACAGSGSGGGASPSGQVGVTVPPSGPLEPGTPKPAAPGALTGILGFASIEGGCAFLQTTEGTRYEVMYPAGWTLDQRAGVLRGPDGEAYAAGDPVSVSGSIATDMASTCQIGPIFVATDVIPGSS